MTAAREAKELFREVQPLHQNMIVRVLVPFETVLMLGIVLPLMLTGSKPVAASHLVVLAGVVLGVPALLFSIRLVSIVTEDSLIIRYRPFPGRRVPIERIESAESIRYNPLGSGGWGWRISPVYHRVFNVSGDRGVHVRFGNGNDEQFLVGSRRTEALVEAIELARFAADHTD